MSLPSWEAILEYFWPVIGVIFAGLCIYRVWQLIVYRHNPEAKYTAFDGEVIAMTASAGHFSLRFGHSELLPEHLLWALLDKPGQQLAEMFRQQGVNSVQAKLELEARFIATKVATSRGPARDTKISQPVKGIIDGAKLIADRRMAKRIAPVDLCLALLEATMASRSAAFDETKACLERIGLMPEPFAKLLRGPSTPKLTH